MRVVLTDFGLARDTVTGSRYTRTGQALGTPAYMSPEQARGESQALTAASDVWALGCVLYELLSGGPRAFDGDGPAAIIGAVLTARVAPLPGVPRDAARLLDGCLERRPTDRPSDAAAVREACRRVLAGRRPGVGQARRRRRAAGAVAGAMLAVAVGAGLAGVWPSREPVAEAPSGPPVADPRRDAETAWARRLDDLPGAIDALRALRERLPDQPAWALRLGLLHWMAGQDADADAVWSGVPMDAPERARAELYLGLRQFSRFWMDEFTAPVRGAAEGHFQAASGAPGVVGQVARAALEVLQMRPGVETDRIADLPGWEAAALRAFAALMRGATADAARDFERLDAEGFNTVWAARWHAMALSLTGATVRAEAVLDRALALHGDWTDGLASRARLRMGRGAHAEAAADVGRLAERCADDATGLFHAAQLYQELGDLRSARATVDRALALQDPYPEALRLRASIRAEAGDAPGALEDYGAALRRRPNDLEARRGRGYLRAAQGDWTGAQADARAAVAAAPTDPHARVLFAICAVRVGATREGEAALDALVAGLTRGDIALLVAADLQRLGEFARAIAVYERAGALATDDRVRDSAAEGVSACRAALGASPR